MGMTSISAITGKIRELDYPEADPPTEEELLISERTRLNPHARAFFAALKETPWPDYPHALAAYRAQVANLEEHDPDQDLVIWDKRIVQIERNHPDLQAWALAMGVSEDVVDGLLDDICRRAMAIERGETGAN